MEADYFFFFAHCFYVLAGPPRLWYVESGRYDLARTRLSLSANSEIGIHLFGGVIPLEGLQIRGDVLEIRVKLSRHGLIDAVFALSRVGEPLS